MALAIRGQSRFCSGIIRAHDPGMNTMTVPTKEGHLILGSSEDALTVCVLDDEQGMVEMLQESLRCLGFSSIGTCDPQYAVLFSANASSAESGTTFRNMLFLARS